MVVHFLTEAAREKYELEKLWTLGRHHDDQYQAMQRILEEQLTASFSFIPCCPLTSSLLAEVHKNHDLSKSV